MKNKLKNGALLLLLVTLITSINPISQPANNGTVITVLSDNDCPNADDFIRNH